MIETVLQIENGIFPFDMQTSKQNNEKNVKVIDVQFFTSLKDLLQKKNQMQKKAQLIEGNYIIKLIKIYQNQLTLHYVYEYVPYSLIGFIDKYYINKGKEVLELNSQNFMKKISFQLTMLISYLARNKIQIDLNINTLGITTDSKLKVYMNYKSRMGHKTELSLVAHYSQCKQKITKSLQAYLNEARYGQHKTRQKENPNFFIKGNKLVFPDACLDQSYESQSNLNYTQNDSFLDHKNYHPESFQSNFFPNTFTHINKSAISDVNPHDKNQSFNLRQTQSHFNIDDSNLNTSKHSTKSATKFPKNHKNSFQFGGKKNNYEKCEEEEDEKNADDDNMSDTKSFSHSRSVRIEFQQKIDSKKKKQRKESFKVKITTFHQYELDDCNPKEFFPQGNSQQTIFQHFNKKFNPQKANQETPHSFNQNIFHRFQQTPRSPNQYERFSNFSKPHEPKTPQYDQQLRFSDFEKQFYQQEKQMINQTKFNSSPKKNEMSRQENRFVKQQNRFKGFENVFQKKKNQQKSLFDCFADEFQLQNDSLGNKCDEAEDDKFYCPITPIPSHTRQPIVVPTTPSTYNRKQKNQYASASFINLQQKVKIAKQKAEILLSKYPRLKKTTSIGV